MRGSPFFEGVTQGDVVVDPFATKEPTFYYDGCATAAFFAAKLGALRRLMPDPRLSPARLAPGLGVVALMCFEYRDTDIGAYNEVAITVGLNEPWFLPNLPGRALLSGMRRRQLHGWVHHLPVTTEIARALGVEICNYPKFIAKIDFAETPAERLCQIAEGQEPILTLAGKRISSSRSGEIQLFSHLWMNRQPQTTEFKINAMQMGISLKPGAASLELGDRHPVARELDGLLVSRRPIQYVYVPRFEAILYGPEHLTLSLINKLSARSSAAEQIGIS